MTQAGRQRSLGRYVPRIAVDWALDAPDQRWREIEASLCFVDISGFTNLSERLARVGRVGAEELTDVLHRVFGRMLDLAYQRGGSLLKFGGDALLLLFEGDGHPAQAASAAVELRDALRESRDWTTSVGRVNLRMSVGVHSGTVQFARVGDSHSELIITGPGASETARMEKVADAGEIVVSAATASALPARCIGAAKGDGFLLRSRAPIVAPPGPRTMQAAPVELVAAHVPVGLRGFLGDSEPDSEHRLACVGFIRFEGTEAMLAEHGGDRVADALHDLVGVVQQHADAEGVTFLASDLDTDGGKIILVTGVPSAQDDDEGRMLRTLRRVIDAPMALRVRAGVNRGHVFAGEIGNDFRATFTVMGDTVNVAARLMAAGTAGDLFAMPAVLDRAHSSFETTDLEPLTVKGKSKPLEAVSVGELLGARRRRRTSLPFAGRESERAAVLKQLEHVGAGRGGGVVLEGLAGMGKSRLVEEVRGDLPELATIVLRGEAYAVDTPYGALREPMREKLGLAGNDATALAALLSATVHDLAPQLRPWVPLLAEVLGVPMAPTPEVAAIDPQFRADRTADVMGELVLAVSPGPTVVIVEDAHWLDDATGHLLHRLALSRLSHWGLIVTRRPAEGGFTIDGLPVVELGPLSAVESKALVVSATDEAPLLSHLVDAIVERAGGNPLFIEEMLHGIDADRLEALPESLDSLVTTEIDRLPPSARRLLRYASVLGRSFHRSVLDEVLLGEGGRVEPDDLSSLDRFLAISANNEISFRHAVHRDAAYAGLTYKRRRVLHRAAAAAIERRHARSLDAVADLLAVHYSLAGADEPAWRWNCIAGDRATRAGATAEAATHYERALDAARRLPELAARDRIAVLIDLGDVRVLSGTFAAALDAYRRGLRLVGSDIELRATLLLRRARANERSASYAAAIRDVNAVIRLCESTRDERLARLHARALALGAVVREAQERPRAALVLSRAAAEAAERVGDDEALARAYMTLNWALRAVGTPGHYYELALAAYERLHDLGGQANVTGNLGMEAYWEGRWQDASVFYAKARVDLLRSGNSVHAHLTGANLGELLLNQGRLDEAETPLREASHALRASKFTEGALFADMQLARLLATRGEHESARAALTRVIEVSRAERRGTSALEAAIYLAEVETSSGRPAAALHLLDEATLEAFERDEFLECPLARTRASALMALGRIDEAETAVAQGIAAAESQDLPYELALLLRTRAAIAEARGGVDLAAIERAAELLRQLGVRPEVGATT